MRNKNALLQLISILSFMLVSSNCIHGQSLNPSKQLSQYNLDHWEGENLPSSILMMAQTSDGYLWMASLNGLVRFDGVKFTVFDKYSSPPIGINSFKSIYEDRHGSFWIGSIGGGLYLKQHNSFKKFQIPFGTSSNNIDRIFLDSKDRLWLCTLKGLIQFKDSTFTLITPKGYKPEQDFSTYDITEDKAGKLWIASSQGVFMYSEGELKKAKWGEASINGETVALHLDQEENLWIAAYGKGVYKAKHNTLSLVKGLEEFTRPTTIKEDRNGSIWIGSEYGVARSNQYGISILVSGEGLSQNHITAICEDHEGSIWLGTYYGGLNRLRDGTFTNYTTLNGLPHNTIHAIYQNPDSSIWVGAENDMVLFKKGTFKLLSEQFPVFSKVKVRDIASDSQGNLWIASYDGVYKLKDKKLTTYTEKDGLASGQARVVFEDNEKNIWIGTRNGISIYKNGNWKTYTEKHGLVNNFIMSIVQLRNGQILVGTTGGLHVFNGTSFELYQTDQGNIRNTIFRIYEDLENNIWLGSNSGLYLISNKKLHFFANDHKLLGGNIYQAIEGHQGTMWLTSDIGIISISKKSLIQKAIVPSMSLNIKVFDKSSGLRTNEITATSKALLTFDKKIWFPTLDGVAVLDPANIITNKTPPPIVIDKIIVSGKELDPKSIINIPSNSKNIEIHYTGLSYMIPKKVQFRYILEGYDKKWIDVGDRRVAYFSSLPPGNYEFKIAASNNDSVWSTEHQSLEFIVAKAFWQTAWFYFLMGLLLIAFIYFIIDLRTKSIKKQNRLLDEKIQERTSEVLQQKEEIEAQRDDIEAKNKELENARNIISDQYLKLRETNETLEEKVTIRTEELQKAYTDLIQINEELDHFVYKSSHDIKGPLARLQGLCNVALMEAKELTSKQYLLMLQKESEMANRVIQKLTHAHQVKNQKVEISKVNLHGIFTETIDKLKAIHSETKEIDISIDIDTNLSLITDEALLGEVVYNLIENAIIFRTDKNPNIKIGAISDGKSAHILISNNGLGIDEKVKDDVFKMFVKGSERSQGLGLGLYIVQKAIISLKGQVSLKKHDKGYTVFEIILPLILE